jgi:acyl-CoA synthetase (AMP-forming)/AMP-acid ligase II
MVYRRQGESIIPYPFISLPQRYFCSQKIVLLITDEQELIKVRGWQVAPAELEACLLAHPRVRDAAVIGVTLSDYHGEVPRAYVVVDNTGTSCDEMASRDGAGYDAAVTEQELKDYLSARLSKYKALKGGVRFVDAIPRGASGKILRGVVRGWVREEFEHELEESGENRSLAAIQANGKMRREEGEGRVGWVLRQWKDLTRYVTLGTFRWLWMWISNI